VTLTADLPKARESYLARCTHCFQPRDDIEIVTIPDHFDSAFWAQRRLCGRCSCLADGKTPVVPAEEMVEPWEWLARQHINHVNGFDTFVDSELIGYALRVHASRLRFDYGWEVFEELMDAVMRRQAAEDPDTVLDCEVLGSEYDAETYVNACRGLVDDAVHKLTGGAR
jgi:hypothetical protein